MKERKEMIKEEVIKIESFDIVQLEKLQKILENNRIIKIENELTDFDIIIIEYEEGKKIDLNEETKLKIKLIRNKYYMKLLNIVDYIFRDKKDFAYDELDEILLRNFINVNKYKYKLKIELINYIGLYNFDNIFELTKEEMEELRKFKFDPNSNNRENIYEEYGMFCHKSEELIKRLEKKIKDDRLPKIKECDRFILICPELIREYCLKYLEKYKDYEIIDESQLFTIIYNKVLTHELGHAIFDYINDYENERRANYYASLTFDGAFDKIIEIFTEHQDERYKRPFLITKDDFKTIKKYVYHI